MLKKLNYLGLILLSLLVLPQYVVASEDISQLYTDSHSYEKMAAYDDAIKSIIPLYKERPGDYFLNLRLGWLYYLAGKYGDSAVYYQRAVEIMPKSLEALLGESLPLMAQSNWQEVERLMNHVINKDHYNFYANLRLASSLRHQMKIKLAERVARKMLETYPANLDFLSELGLTLKLKGEKEETSRIFRNILYLDPQNVTARGVLKKM